MRVGLATLAAVVPDEMKLPNCRPILALAVDGGRGLPASTTGVTTVVLIWVMVRPSSPPLPRSGC